MTHHLGIDVETALRGDYNEFIRRLRDLKSTVRAESMGQYRECPTWRMVYVETTMSERELDDWCYNYNGRCFIEMNVFEWQGEIPQ